jgi:quercetin dioxygenase-like cupin family protein
MNESVIVRGPGEGRTLLVGGGDQVTYKVRSSETDGSYFCFEVSTTPGFGPPLHSHSYRELFYVLEGVYEFTLERDGDLETTTGTPGTAIAVPPHVPHTFKNASGEPARLLFVHQPAALEAFFEEFGAPTDNGEATPPQFSAMAAALERNGVHIVGAPHEE